MSKMQDMEIVVVNFGEGKPIYTEAVFPDPEVRSIFANREEEARSRRRLARRRNRNARHRRNNASSDRANGNNTQGEGQSNTTAHDSANRNEMSEVRENEDGWFVLSIPLSNSSSPRHFSSRPNSRQQLTVPPANQNRHHPGEEEMEFFLSPEATPEPSPASSPVVKRIGKKWINSALRQVSGCRTCRGDLAILTRHRPQLREASFMQVG